MIDFWTVLFCSDNRNIFRESCSGKISNNWNLSYIPFCLSLNDSLQYINIHHLFSLFATHFLINLKMMLQWNNTTHKKLFFAVLRCAISIAHFSLFRKTMIFPAKKRCFSTKQEEMCNENCTNALKIRLFIAHFGEFF